MMTTPCKVTSIIIPFYFAANTSTSFSNRHALFRERTTPGTSAYTSFSTWRKFINHQSVLFCFSCLWYAWCFIWVSTALISYDRTSNVPTDCSNNYDFTLVAFKREIHLRDPLATIAATVLSCIGFLAAYLPVCFDPENYLASPIKSLRSDHTRRDPRLVTAPVALRRSLHYAGILTLILLVKCVEETIAKHDVNKICYSWTYGQIYPMVFLIQQLIDFIEVGYEHLVRKQRYSSNV